MMAYELPSEKSEKVHDLSGFIILCQGEKKIGKTSLWSHAESPFFMMCEPGSKGLELYEERITSWKKFRVVAKTLAKMEHDFKTVIIDTGDLAYDMCLDWVCMDQDFDHPADLGYGKGWKAVKREFVREITRLANTGMGLVVISHVVEREVKTRHSGTFDKLVPTMSGQARDVFESLVDIWINYDYEGSKRIIQVVGDDYVSAGHRLYPDHFCYTDGSPIKQFDAGTSSREAWEQFNKAFNNEMDPPPPPKKKKKRRKTQDEEDD